jgi:hypothetical protein
MELDEINKLLVQIARGDSQNITKFIEKGLETSIHGTVLECHYLKIDPNGRPRLSELIKEICSHVIDYAIPRSTICKAFSEKERTGSTAEITKLATQARGLFTDLSKTGEGGELLLFLLAEQYLRLPQAFAKMYLKTDENVHFHGADGAYLGVDNNTLCLYWGESKFHKDHSSALADCFKSVKPFLKLDSGSESDLRLINFLDLNNPEFEKALKPYFEYTSEQYDKLRPCAICLIGFDFVGYREENICLTNEIVKEKLINHFNDYWKATLTKHIEDHELKFYKIYMFYLPLKSVDDYRDEFLKALG